jgi:hypothetical protein
MKTIKLSEEDIVNIVNRVISEASSPKIMRTIEPPQRNISTGENKPKHSGKSEISLYDKDMKRKELTQKTVDRILKYGDMYVKKLEELNRSFPIKKDRFGQY